MDRCKKLWAVLLPTLMVAMTGCSSSDPHYSDPRQRPQRVIVQSERRSRPRRQGRERFNEAPSRTCPTCGGHGHLVCRMCNGRGRVSCDTCRGTGTDSTNRKCVRCRGNGRHGCTTCGIIMGTSDGQVQCNRCRGRGTISP